LESLILWAKSNLDFKNTKKSAFRSMTKSHTIQELVPSVNKNASFENNIVNHVGSKKICCHNWYLKPSIKLTFYEIKNL
jgi:uncharacterized protein (DUF927 family)